MHVKIEIEDDELATDGDVKQWLKECEKVIDLELVDLCVTLTVQGWTEEEA